MKSLYIVLALSILLSSTDCCQAQPIRLQRLIIEQYDTTAFKTNIEHKFYYSGNRQGIPPGILWTEQLTYSINSQIDSVYKYYPNLAYDSVVTHVYPYYQSLYNYYVKHQKFDANNNLSDSKKTYWAKGFNKWQTLDSNTYIYNSNGNIKKRINLYANDSTVYYYSSSGYVDSIRIYAGSTIYRQYSWKYDLSGNIIESRDPNNYLVYEYDNNSRINAIYYLGSYHKDTVGVRYFTYDSNGDLIEYTHKVGSSLLSFVNHHKVAYMNDANHNRTYTKLMFSNAQDPNIMDNEYELYYTYNAYGLIERQTQKIWDKQTNAFVYGYFLNGKYRFATKITFDYGLPLNVGEVKPSNSTIRVYPIPSAGVITIEAYFKKAQPFVVSIHGVDGRMYRQWDEPPAKEYIRSIPVTDLPAGNYIIKIEGESEKNSKRFVTY